MHYYYYTEPNCLHELPTHFVQNFFYLSQLPPKDDDPLQKWNLTCTSSSGNTVDNQDYTLSPLRQPGKQNIQRLHHQQQCMSLSLLLNSCFSPCSRLSRFLSCNCVECCAVDDDGSRGVVVSFVSCPSLPPPPPPPSLSSSPCECHVANCHTPSEVSSICSNDHMKNFPTSLSYYQSSIPLTTHSLSRSKSTPTPPPPLQYFRYSSFQYLQENEEDKPLYMLMKTFPSLIPVLSLPATSKGDENVLPSKLPCEFNASNNTYIHPPLTWSSVRMNDNKCDAPRGNALRQQAICDDDDGEKMMPIMPNNRSEASPPSTTSAKPNRNAEHVTVKPTERIVTAATLPKSVEEPKTDAHGTRGSSRLPSQQTKAEKGRGQRQQEEPVYPGSPPLPGVEGIWKNNASYTFIYDSGGEKQATTAKGVGCIQAQPTNAGSPSQEIIFLKACGAHDTDFSDGTVSTSSMYLNQASKRVDAQVDHAIDQEEGKNYKKI